MRVADDTDCRICMETAKGRDNRPFDFGHKCDTQNGSSGSPILANRDYRLVGIHHWGYIEGDEIEQNQGVKIQYILGHIKKQAEIDSKAREVYKAILAIQ